MKVTLYGTPDTVTRVPFPLFETQWVVLPFSPHPGPEGAVIEPKVTLALLDNKGDFSFFIARMTTDEARELRKQLDEAIKYREEQDERKFLS